MDLQDGFSRRGLLMGMGALALSACNNGVGSNGAAQIDARVEATQSFLFSRYPGTQDLASRAKERGDAPPPFAQYSPTSATQTSAVNARPIANTPRRTSRAASRRVVVR